MACRQHGEEGLPEWIMSYADMITILMAFFVVMYSMAGEKDPPKEQAVMESLRTWLGPVRGRTFNPSGSSGLRGGYPGIQPRRQGGDSESGNQHGTSGSTTWRVVQSLGGSVYFDQSEADLSPRHREQLQQVADLLAGKRQLVEIHGVPGPRWMAAVKPDEAWDEVWSKCRLVADHMAMLGIERQRLQINVASPAAEPQDRNLLRDDFDLRIDVTLADRFVREP
jgi:chemotaxis protein MotB